MVNFNLNRRKKKRSTGFNNKSDDGFTAETGLKMIKTF